MWNSVNNDQCSVHQCSRNPDGDNLGTPSPMEGDDLSMFENARPAHCPSFNTIRRSLKYEDSDSQDSGYEAACSGENKNFPIYVSPLKTSLFLNLDSMEDEVIDFSEIKSPEKPKNLPHGFGQLIDNPSVPLSFQSTNAGIVPSKKTRPNLLRARSVKRPAPLTESEISRNIKKLKIFDNEEVVPKTVAILLRPVSTKETIMSVMQKSSTESGLIGDFSKNFALPLVENNYQDLKTITPTTLAQLIKGEFRDTIEWFKIVDCRYPYEFDSGHIQGSVNIYTEGQCLELLDAERIPVQSNSKKRHILVFHCEFSAERGPNLYRYLRQEDRHRNETFYPYLYYPEMYLLEGGYKQFFEQFSRMCVPVGYKTMLHPDHKQDLRRFRQKSNMQSRNSSQHFKYGRNLKKQKLEL